MHQRYPFQSARIRPTLYPGARFTHYSPPKTHNFNSLLTATALPGAARPPARGHSQGALREREQLRPYRIVYAHGVLTSRYNKALNVRKLDETMRAARGRGGTGAEFDSC